MDECKHHNEFINDIKQINFEIKDRLARIETKQDHANSTNERFHREIAALCLTGNEHSKQIAILNSEINNLKWTAGIVAGIVTGLLQFFLYLFKGR